MTTLVLNGISLNTNMRWDERTNSQNTVSEVKYTLGGRLIQRGGQKRNQDCTLIADQDAGWLKKSVVDQLIALATDFNGVYTLDVNGETHQVMFRHEESPVVEMQPITSRINPDADDYYIGKIKLRIV